MEKNTVNLQKCMCCNLQHNQCNITAEFCASNKRSSLKMVYIMHQNT